MLKNQPTMSIVGSNIRFFIALILPSLYIALFLLYLIPLDYFILAPKNFFFVGFIFILGVLFSLLGGKVLITFPKWYYLVPLLLYYLISVAIFIIFGILALAAGTCMYGGTCL